MPAIHIAEAQQRGCRHRLARIAVTCTICEPSQTDPSMSTTIPASQLGAAMTSHARSSVRRTRLRGAGGRQAAVDEAAVPRPGDRPDRDDYRGTTVGGLSSITYDARRGVYYTVSDDPAAVRYYTVGLDLRDGRLSNGDVRFENVTTCWRPATCLRADRDRPGRPGADEGPRTGADVRGLREHAGRPVRAAVRARRPLPRRAAGPAAVPPDARPAASPEPGVRERGRARHDLFVATENALVQDGPAATIAGGSPARILRYDLRKGRFERQWFYETDPVAEPPVPADRVLRQRRRRAASSRSDLPSIRRAERLGRLTSITATCLGRSRVRVAPNEPVLSTPIAWTRRATASRPAGRIAAIGGRELLVTEESAVGVDRRRVVRVLVSVDATDDGRWPLRRCHAGTRSSVGPDLTVGEPAGRYDRSVTGLLDQAPIRSDPSGRHAPRRGTRAGRHIERRTPRSNLCRGQTGPVPRRA